MKKWLLVVFLIFAGLFIYGLSIGHDLNNALALGGLPFLALLILLVPTLVIAAVLMPFFWFSDSPEKRKMWKRINKKVKEKAKKEKEAS